VGLSRARPLAAFFGVTAEHLMGWDYGSNGEAA